MSSPDGLWVARVRVDAHRLRPLCARANDLRRREAATGLVHHSDTQYLSVRYTDRLADAGMAPSVGSRGDAYDNALAESVIGLFKTEVIRRLGPWRSLEAVEFATLSESIGSTPGGSSGRSATSPQRSTRRGTISRPPWPESTNSPSDRPGTLQSRSRPHLPRDTHSPTV